MKRSVVGIVGIVSASVLIGAAGLAVGMAATSSGLRACADSKGDLVLAVKGKCPRHDAKVTVNLRGPKGANGKPGLPGKPGKDFQYAHVVVVKALGTPGVNGTALKTALSAITTASAATPYLLYVEPGVYDVTTAASTGLAAKPYVDIEGAGTDMTTITTSADAPALALALHMELRDISVNSTSTAADATALDEPDPGSGVFEHVDGIAVDSSAGSGVTVEGHLAMIRSAINDSSATGAGITLVGGYVDVSYSELGGQTGAIFAAPSPAAAGGFSATYSELGGGYGGTNYMQLSCQYDLNLDSGCSPI